MWRRCARCWGLQAGGPGCVGLIRGRAPQALDVASGPRSGRETAPGIHQFGVAVFPVAATCGACPGACCAGSLHEGSRVGHGCGRHRSVARAMFTRLCAGRAQGAAFGDGAAAPPVCCDQRLCPGPGPPGTGILRRRFRRCRATRCCPLGCEHRRRSASRGVSASPSRPVAELRLPAVDGLLQPPDVVFRPCVVITAVEGTVILILIAGGP